MYCGNCLGATFMLRRLALALIACVEAAFGPINGFLITIICVVPAPGKVSSNRLMLSYTNEIGI